MVALEEVEQPFDVGLLASVGRRRQRMGRPALVDVAGLRARCVGTDRRRVHECRNARGGHRVEPADRAEDVAAPRPLGIAGGLEDPCQVHDDVGATEVVCQVRVVRDVGAVPRRPGRLPIGQPPRHAEDRIDGRVVGEHLDEPGADVAGGTDDGDPHGDPSTLGSRQVASRPHRDGRAAVPHQPTDVGRQAGVDDLPEKPSAGGVEQVGQPGDGTHEAGRGVAALALLVALLVTEIGEDGLEVRAFVVGHTPALVWAAAARLGSTGRECRPRVGWFGRRPGARRSTIAAPYGLAPTPDTAWSARPVGVQPAPTAGEAADCHPRDGDR